jgi:hypothetical protein
MIDLADAPVVDAHCHPWRNEDVLAADPSGFEDRVTITGTMLGTAGRAAELRHLTETTPLALAMRRRLAERLGCEPTRDAVAAARRAALERDARGYIETLLRDAGVTALVYDEGYPQPTIPLDEFAAACGVRVHRVARIEPFIVRLREQASTYDELEETFVATLEGECADPELVAFKSVIAYRTGLDVGDPTRADCRAGFQAWRASGFAEPREHAKPVRDALLRRTLEVCRRNDRPLHIHCGGGDPDVVLGHARPQDLYPLLAAHSAQPIVLIHSGWPWVEEAAYIASIQPHVHLDVSLLTPWTSLALDQKLEVLLGAAPPAKVMHGSDEAGEPEVIWLAAHVAREALGRVLGLAVERRWLDAAEARGIGEGVLARNVRTLHGLT